MFMEEYLSEKNLEHLLKFLYPESTWIKDKIIPNDVIENRSKQNGLKDFQKRLFRPDYRDEENSIIVEFDGLAHYQDSSVFWNDIEREIYYTELGYKFIQIPYFVQPTKEIVKLYFGIDVDSDLTNKRNGFNILIKGKINKNCPSSFSELGVRRFMVEFNKFDIVTQNGIIDTLYQNYQIAGLSMKILPLSLIDFLSFEITEEDEKFNESFNLKNYKIEKE